VPQRRALALLMALMAISAYAPAFTPVETSDIGTMINEVASRIMSVVLCIILIIFLSLGLIYLAIQYYSLRRLLKRSGRPDQMRCTCYCE